MQKKTLMTALVAGFALPATAFALTVGDTMGTDMDEIRSQIEAEGYKVLEIENEDGEVEVEYAKDGQVYEVSIAANSGQVLEIELEDGDKDDD